MRSVAARPTRVPTATEVVADEMRALDAELDQRGVEMTRVALHAVVEVGGLVGATEARHVERNGAAELADAAEEILPVTGAAGIAVHEHHRLARPPRPRLQERRADAVDSNLARRHDIARTHLTHSHPGRPRFSSPPGALPSEAGGR
jgi:hypothetical protein